MPSGLLSNLNVAFSFGFPRAVRVKKYQPLHLIEALFFKKSSCGSVSGSTSEVIRYSSNRSYTKSMAASGSKVASGDLMVDALASSCGNLSSFVKPGGVFFGDKSHKICRRAKVRMGSGETESHHGSQGCLVVDFERRYNKSALLFSKGLSSSRTFSSSCYSDGIAPEVSTDGSLSAEQLSSLALSAEQYVFLFPG